MSRDARHDLPFESADSTESNPVFRVGVDVGGTFTGGGYGGWNGGDGISNGTSIIGISKTQPVEVLEQQFPVLFESYGLRNGSAGAGRWRGGLGVS